MVMFCALTRCVSINSNVCVCVCLSALLGILYAEEKERLDFVYTIYHWCQAIAIFIVYLWSNLPMRVCIRLCVSSVSREQQENKKGLFNSVFLPTLQAKLSILMATLLLACYCYWVMESRLARNVPHRLPRIPRPRHKVTNLSLPQITNP